MKLEGLSENEIKALLHELPHWTLNANRKLERHLTFKDFSETFAFMTAVALWAEKHDHHPEWYNVYNRLKIELTSHDVGAVSQKDANLARHIESLMRL